MKLVYVFLLFIAATAFARDPYLRNGNIDILHYAFQLEFNDTTDILAGDAAITVLFRKSAISFDLDLASKTKNLGMQVIDVTRNGVDVSFYHRENKLHITLPARARAGDQLKFRVRYSGIPEDGLIISRNKFGERTFFGDNWPDRGHHWLPVIDHPSDKAQVDFTIIAPEQYQVIATGIKIEESNLPKKRKLIRWQETADVPVKVMAIGIARFATQQSGVVNNIPITTWVFPQNSDEGFFDFSDAPKVFEFFNSHIGPYSYKKLAHVQSKTRWGGLENAGNIFYFENVVNGKNNQPALIAHETAHQWFGNSVTENDWHHVWLSEGFSTYFSNAYLGYANGHDKLNAVWREQRSEVIAYYQKNSGPIVDTTITVIGNLLNTNTYSKAAWVLHMLQHELGDATFWAGIQLYYRTYQNKNALTADFRRVMEDVSGKDLSMFFSQWLYRGGHPAMQVSSDYDSRTKTINFHVRQGLGGSALFKTPLEIGIWYAENDEPVIREVRLEGLESQKFSIASDKKPAKIMLDPNVNLLFEEKSKN